ncbi:MAG TPA: hypothetical protein DCO86_04375, partial [Spirochaetaceae bacterium]|nr:hypothetical protein [Spirochaetaceae bacterium]
SDFLGRGFDYVNGSLDDPISYVKNRVIDMVALRNKFKYTAQKIKLNSTTQYTVTGDNKEEFINDVLNKEGKATDFNMNTEFYGAKLKMDFKNHFSNEQKNTNGATTKNFYSKYKGRIYRQRHFIHRCYTTPEYLSDCLMTDFKANINDSSVSPETIFEKYGTHVLMDVYLGAAVYFNLTGSYDTTTTSKNVISETNQKYVVYESQSKLNSDYTRTSTISNIHVEGNYLGGPAAEIPIWIEGSKGGGLVGDISAWALGINDSNMTLIETPYCLSREDESTGIWNFATSAERKKEIKKAYLRMCNAALAELLSGTVRYKDDGLYVKHFGFVTICNPNYPKSSIDGESSVVGNDGYIYLENPGTAGEGFKDFPENMLLNLAYNQLQKIDKTVTKDQIEFFRTPGSSKLFKIVDARRSIYSDPYDYKEGSDTYSVRLSSLRYKHSKARGYDSIPDADGQKGYVFYYPYQVLTSDSDEALTGIITSTSCQSEDANTNVLGETLKRSEKNYMFSKNDKLKEACYDYGQPPSGSDWDALNKHAKAGSWTLVTDRYFNTIRQGDGRNAINYSLSLDKAKKKAGRGDILENPIYLGDFGHVWCDQTVAESRYKDVREPTIYTISLSDTGFKCYDHMFPEDNRKNVFESFFRVKNTDRAKYGESVSTTFGDSQNRFMLARHRDPNDNLLNQKCDGYQFDSTYLDSYTGQPSLFDGNLFNSFYPDRFPFSGSSRIQPALVYTSRTMDEQGNTRELDKARPIKAIAFMLCKNNDNPDALDQALTTAGDTKDADWELTEYPVGAGEWEIMRGDIHWNTSKRVYAPRPYSDSFYGYAKDFQNAYDVMRRAGYHGGCLSDNLASFRVEYGPILFNQIEDSSSTRAAKIADGEFNNYFTKYTSEPVLIPSGSNLISVSETVIEGSTDTNPKTKPADTRDNRLNEDHSSYRISSGGPVNSYKIDFSVCDMDRHDMYIIFRR